MNEVTIPKNRLMAMWIIIAALVVLLVLSYLQTRPTIDSNVLNFQETLKEGPFRGAALIGDSGSFRFFDKKLAEQEPCGEIGNNKEIPEACLKGIKQVAPKINTLTVLTFPSSDPNYPKPRSLAIFDDPKVVPVGCTHPDGSC